LPITGRPIRLAVVGLGQVSELVLPSYAARDDIEIVGLCDLAETRRARWGEVFPDACQTADIGAALATAPDVVDVLVPTPAHGEVVTRILDAGFHVQVQKPIARSMEDADAMLAAADRNGATLRVLEDYLFYPPLAQLRAVVESGELGPPSAVHMKIVGTGRGGWDVPESSFRWQWEQQRDGRGMLVFDHGWHQLAIAHWLFGPIGRIFAWIGSTRWPPTSRRRSCSTRRPRSCGSTRTVCAA
jgi:predicted dehydrogenase